MEETEINGKKYFIEMILSKNKTATARVKEGKIIIKIPNRWPESEKSKALEKLKARMFKAMERNPSRFEQVEISFNDGQQLALLGNTFNINIQNSKGRRSTARLIENNIKIRLAEGLNDEETKKRVRILIRKAISKSLLPVLTSRVQSINERHFNFQFKSIRIKEMTSRWGSCSSSGCINLSFYLLFAPEEVLDYVIIHELAHIRVRNHGGEFWNLVGSAMPDYLEKRKWLNKNASKISAAQNAPALNSYNE